MTRTISMLTAAAIAAPATAQVTITIDAPDHVETIGTFTITISASASVTNVGATGFAIRVGGTGRIVQGSVRDLLNPPSPPGGFTVVAESQTELVVENFVAFFGGFGRTGIGASGPEALFSLEIETIDGPGIVTIETGISDQSLATGANDAGFIATNFDVVFDTADVINDPAPGTAGALALAGLAAARRRR